MLIGISNLRVIKNAHKSTIFFAYVQNFLYFCSVKSSVKICLLLLSMLLLLPSCNHFERGTERIRRVLHVQQRQADELTQHLKMAIERNDFDSIWHFAQFDKSIAVYIYKGRKLVYWSNAWLSLPDRQLQHVYDQWHYMQWNNAQGVCRHVKVGEYRLVVAIPIKYNYSVTSAQLHNGFVKPFRGEEQWRLTFRQIKGQTTPIFSYDGAYLFSIEQLSVGEAEQEASHYEAIENFSYQSLLATDNHKNTLPQTKMRAYYVIALVLIGLMLIVAIVSLIRYRGFRRMRLGGKFQIVLTPMVLVILLSIFLVSIDNSRKVFIETQQLRLTKKAQYVQLALQNMYFWDLNLSPSNTASLNIDLRDMSFVYETDIHVYDLQGRLIGTSTPQLFNQGLLPTHIAPEPFFSDVTKLVQYEQIGNVRYLSAYTEFVNGNYAKIGYIALPSFISQEEMGAKMQEFIVQLMPLYMLLLVASIFVVWIISHMVTSSLGMVTQQLQKHQMGQPGKHIDYPFSDEVGEMVTHYNQMMDALAESTERLARSEREIAWRTMARQVAHEINNPLTPMKLTLQQLQRTKGTERFDDYFNRSTQLLIDQIDNLSYIAKSFSSFAKMPEVNPSEVDVAAKLYAFITLMRNNPSEVPIRYIGPEKGVLAIADAEQIVQVFTNIVRNALQAMEGRMNSDIIIILKGVPNSARRSKELSESCQWVEISFSDNGPGIPEESQEKVFVPNFTTKNTGAGLGLPISKNIVEGSGGKICFQTSEKGTTFFVYLRKK